MKSYILLAYTQHKFLRGPFLLHLLPQVPPPLLLLALSTTQKYLR